MTLTREQLLKIMPNAGARVDKYLSYLNRAMQEFCINLDPVRMAHFLAQVAHESAELRYVKELASGKNYEGRKDLGNTVPGYGVKYKGRGLLQLTGFYNYRKYKIYCGFDVVGHPELLEQPRGATRSAAWIWQRGLGVDLNHVADSDDGRNSYEICKQITKRINGGTNGLDSRWKYTQRALAVLRT